jgi:threonine 3-dehydrogenase
MTRERMRAARFLGAGEVALEDVPVPRPGPGDVLLRVDACALCGTDVRAFRNGGDVIPGHEIVGTVVELGDGVERPPLGAFGAVYLVEFCSSCYPCRHGWTNMCAQRKGMYGFTAPGGFAEYVAVRAACFLAVDTSIGAEAATCVLDLFGTTAHAFRRAGGSPSVVAVIGCGPIGLGAIALARVLGAEVVYGLDVASYRLDLGRRLGARPLDVREDDVVQRLLEMEPDGCDVVIESAGRTDTQRQAIQVAAAGGRIVIIAHNDEPLEVLTHRDLIARERSLVGSEYFPIGEFEEVHRLVAGGLLDPVPIQTHHFPLERFGEACHTFWSGEAGKVVVLPHEAPSRSPA